jgi:hypothetical protein
VKISNMREFREKAPGMLRSKNPVLVTRRGRLAGVFFPQPEATLPLELKRGLFAVLSADVERQISQRGLSEDEILADFSAWQKKRREGSR